jgi:hypothetical protein
MIEDDTAVVAGHPEVQRASSTSDAGHAAAIARIIAFA